MALMSLTKSSQRHFSTAIGLNVRCVAIAAALFPSVHVQAQPDEIIPNDLNLETVQVIDQGLGWLATRQRENGSFGDSDEYTENVGVTALCGMAFLCAGSVPEGGEYADHVSRTIDYLLNCSQQNGYLIDADGTSHGPMYGHGFGTMFLAEVYGMSPRDDLPDKLRRAIDLIIATQNSEGGWRYYPVADEADISVTVCQVMALRAARNAGISVPKEVIDRAVEYIRSCQNPDGGFRYRIFDAAESRYARSAAAVVALYSAGLSDGATLENGLTFVERELRLGVDRDYSHYARYYAAQAIWHAGEKRWDTGFPILRDAIIADLVESHWEDRQIGDEYATAMALIVLQLPYDVVPIFER